MEVNHLLIHLQIPLKIAYNEATKEKMYKSQHGHRLLGLSKHLLGRSHPENPSMASKQMQYS